MTKAEMIERLKEMTVEVRVMATKIQLAHDDLQAGIVVGALEGAVAALKNACVEVKGRFSESATAPTQQ